MAHDLLGRMVKRADLYTGTVSTALGQTSQSTSGCAGHDASHTATWSYDTASGAGKGQLYQASAPGGYARTLVYDAFGRNTQVTEQISGASYVTNMAYDTRNRLAVLTYPGPSNRLAVKHVYNARGYLSELRNNASNALYQQVNALDARGNAVDETHGNGLTTIKVYNAATGYLTELRTGTVTSPLKNDRQNLGFSFDKLGNLTARSDTIRGFSETFSYDGLNRLTGTSANFGNGELQTTTVTYDALGNIRTKTGVGTYQYGSQCGAGNRMHAVCQITGGSIGTKTTSYAYDANGNMSSGDGRSITWSAFNKPVGISQGANSATLGYGPERQLLTRIDDANGQVTSTVHVGGLYEKVTLPGGAVEERHTVGGNTLVTYTNRTAGGAGTIKTRYLLKDHLGSVTAITDEAGDEVEAFSFDAWGKRRAPTLAQLQGLLGNWSTLDGYQRGNLTIPALLLGSALTERGFTGHRQLDGVGLIHMGGRVYDAEIGRFLSADPFTGDSTNLQALNRYTYVENNPLSYTDPSGYFLKKLVKKIGNAIKRVVSAVVEFERELRRKVLRAVGSIEGLSSLISLALNFIPTCSGWCAMMLQGAYSAAMADANGGTIAQVLKAGAIAFVRAGLEQRGGGATSFGSRGSDSPGMIFHLDTAAKSVGQDGAGSWFKEDFLPEIVARLRKMEKKAQAKIRNESSSAVPQTTPCTPNGTITGFLEQHGAEIVDRTLSIVGGAGQVALGVSICTGGVTCAGGAILAAHGASNIWEGATGTSSLLREGYHAALGSAGDLAYSVVNIGTSAYGLTRSVVKPGTWKLFRNISSDYVPAFKTMTGTELVTEGAGLINDGLNAAGVPLQQYRRP